MMRFFHCCLAALFLTLSPATAQIPGAMGDGVYIDGNITIASGSPNLTVLGASFVSTDIGKAILVPAAGVAGKPLAAIITGYTSPTQITLSVPASTGLAPQPATVLYGTNDAPAIQAAINALPESGGDLVFPAGIYVVTSEIVIGNGTSSAASTRYGVRLSGVGVPSFSFGMFTGYPNKPAVVIASAGTAGNVIKIAGPLQGWGIENIAIDCGAQANNGLLVVSGQFGDSRNVPITNCRNAGIYSDTVASSVPGVSNVDSLHNSFYNTAIFVPSIAGAKGIALTGKAASNTDYNVFTNTAIYNGGNGVAGFGIYLQACDSNQFFNIHFFNGGPNFAAVTLDYTVNNSWPASNMLYGIDVGPPGINTTFQNSGTPGSSARKNIIYGLIETNGGVWPVGIPNLVSDIP